MSEHEVFLFDLDLAPLNGRNPDRPGRVVEFSDERGAMRFAESVRLEWDRVLVYRKGHREPLVEMQKGDTYIGGRRVIPGRGEHRADSLTPRLSPPNQGL